MREPEEAEREEDRCSAGSPGPTRLEPARDDQHLAREERGRGKRGERPERQPDGERETRSRAGQAADLVRARAMIMGEERRRRVEAEALRDRMPRDVHDQAASASGLAKPTASASTPMCSRLE